MARPREFDPDDALSRITPVFWEKGYEGSSLHDLEAATGLNRQSLYRAFGDKRGMYLAALAAYDETEGARMIALLAKPGGARRRVARAFDKTIIEAAKVGDRSGCFLCNASLDQTQLDDQTSAFVAKTMAKIKNAFASALAASEPYASDRRRRARTASMLLAAYLGLRVLVRANIPVAELRRAADRALEAI